MPMRLTAPSLIIPSMRAATDVHDVCKHDAPQDDSSEPLTTKPSPMDIDPADSTPSAILSPTVTSKPVSAKPTSNPGQAHQETQPSPPTATPQPVSALPTNTPGEEDPEAESPLNSKQNTTTKPTAPSSSGLSASGDTQPSTSEENSIWAWLGPTLGLLGAVLAAVAAITAAFITRNGFWTDFAQNFNVQNRG